MSQTTILVIDDSATIRRLVDSHLSEAGYRVVLAPNAEEGIALAPQLKPNLILLDHQLPGTTGYHVCRQLMQFPELKNTPVIVTSTLRKRAYAEYTEIPNVVDSLPKPFTPELLMTTVSSALDTGSLIVQCQADGSAVPEVIQSVSDTSLSGSFASFGLREVLDFLNNGCKRGALEVETARHRAWFYLNGGRVQAVVAPSVDPGIVVAKLPESLRNLASVLNFTIGGTLCAQLNAVVDLLDKKVLDPRMLRSLLRHQAAVLTHMCFAEERRGFRFEPERAVPAIFSKLPLDISLAALLVEAASFSEESELPVESPETVYVRRAVRGQNLDRAGLSAQHMKLLGRLEQPHSTDDLVREVGMERNEVRHVIHGLIQADWVQSDVRSRARTVLALETDATGVQQIHELFVRDTERYVGKVVRDRLGMQLLLKRSRPDAILLALDNGENLLMATEMRRSKEFGDSKLVGILPSHGANHDGDLPADPARLHLDAVLRRPYSADQMAQTLDGLFENTGSHPQLAASAY
jgi:CheY-like chemotaxis protein